MDPAHRAELLGFAAREAEDSREENPYLEHRPTAPAIDPFVEAMVAAWWEGWDRANAILEGH